MPKHDETAVLQVVDDGHHLALEGEDQVEALRRMVERDLPADLIQDRLKINERRYRTLLEIHRITRPEKDWSWTAYSRGHGYP